MERYGITTRHDVDLNICVFWSVLSPRTRLKAGFGGNLPRVGRAFPIFHNVLTPGGKGEEIHQFGCISGNLAPESLIRIEEKS